MPPPIESTTLPDGPLIQNLYLSIDPAMRSWVCDLDNDLPAVANDTTARLQKLPNAQNLNNNDSILPTDSPCSTIEHTG